MGVLLVEPCADFIAKIVLGWIVPAFDPGWGAVRKVLLRNLGLISQ